MATIKLQRTSEYVNKLRDYQIYIDGKKIGTIANSETKEFETTNGQHSLVAKIDWCSSPEITFDLNNSQNKEFKIGGFKNGNWIMPIGLFLVLLGFILNQFLNSIWSLFIALPVLAIFVYYLTIGRKKYLTLTELN
jgi:hypothetical protein